MKRALISGISGQDGSYMAELLLKYGYEVHGLIRKSSQLKYSSYVPLWEKEKNSHLTLHYTDLSDHVSLRRIINNVKPDEFYHFAGQSHVGLSFEIPEVTVEETALATLRLLEICRSLPSPPRIFHAASAEVFGHPTSFFQTEKTPFRPVNPYGCAKVCAANLCSVYRESHGMFIVNGILYNHESPRRAANFVTRKITMAAARAYNGTKEILELGNLESERDWGYAPQFVYGMWRSLQQDLPTDYVLATGKSTSVRNFVIAAFSSIGITLEFKGCGEFEHAIDSKSGQTLLRVNSKFLRPQDSHYLVGDATKAMTDFNWNPDIFGTRLAEILTQAEVDNFIP